MDDIKGPLILDLVEWVAQQPRSYGEVMAAWRTSCPRLTIWEDSVDQGYVERVQRDVRVTPRGRAALEATGRLPRRTEAA